MADTGSPGGKDVSEETGSGYRVLARKYRPSDFSDLVGQEPMVRTLRNAFTTNRIHQAYIFTGVRGVGKTTTARIIARGLNFEREDGSGGPTVDLTEKGVHCDAILESRHVDVIEMDAASHTGINDIREIIDQVRYKPAYARYKVYIIDEVHMLSNAAFNGLLKTLEEPPPHVKFLFATTEIRKVPVTVLSRCQRFDLRRITAADMTGYLNGIAGREDVSIDSEALNLIARASEGSMRDALSLMDQAIAHGGGSIAAEQLRVSLGLADRTRVLDLFGLIMKGAVAEALVEVREQYDSGADPNAIIADLAEVVHMVTRLKVAPGDSDGTMSEAERGRGQGFAEALPQKVLTRAWQMLIKGIAEVQAAARPITAAEMLIVRLCYAADLPTPDEVIRRLRDGAGAGGAGATNGSLPPRGPQAMAAMPQPRGNLSLATSRAAPAPVAIPATSAAPAMRIRRFEDIPAIAAEKRDISLKIAVERDIRLVSFQEGRIEINVAPGRADVATKLSRALQDWTGQRWVIGLSQAEGEASLQEKEDARKAEETRGVRANPTVRAVLDAFPGAEITRVDLVRQQEAAEGDDDAPPAPDHLLPVEDDDEL